MLVINEAYGNGSMVEYLLSVLRSTDEGKDAEIIGEVVDNYKRKVILEAIVGGKRIIEPSV